MNKFVDALFYALIIVWLVTLGFAVYGLIKDYI